MDELFFLIPAFPILLGIGFGICAAFYVTALLLEHSNDNGNSEDPTGQYERSIFIIAHSDDMVSDKGYTKSPGFHYKDKNPHM